MSKAIDDAAYELSVASSDLAAEIEKLTSIDGAYFVEKLEYYLDKRDVLKHRERHNK